MKYDYWYGPDDEDRRVKYATSFSSMYQANGDDVQRRIEAVVTAFRGETGIELPSGYASGWRSPAVNEATANAGKASTHLSAQAGDKRDTVDGSFAWWCLRTPHVLEIHGVWQEHPIATVVRSWVKALAQGLNPTPWCHLQSVPPRSGNRIYWPDGSAFSEWQRFEAEGGNAGMTYKAWQTTQIQPQIQPSTRPKAKKSADL